MTVYKNPELFKVHGDKKITVSVTFSASAAGGDKLAIKNAAEALAMFANTGNHKSWEYQIEVKK